MVDQRISSSRNSLFGLWLGAGITSTTARTRSDGATGLAAMINDDDAGSPIVFSLGAETLTAQAVLVSYAINGDANLDGRIDALDYFRIDRGLLTGGNVYRSGD